MLSRVIRVAVISPQEVVVRGLTAMLADYPDRLIVAALPAIWSKATGVDVVVYDTLGLYLGDGSDFEHLLRETDAKVLIFSRDIRPDLRARAFAMGARAWVSMSTHAGDLLHSIELTAAGQAIDEPEDQIGTLAGLTTRETEVLALITQGLSNRDIANKLVLSMNTLKSHIRQIYRKIEVTTRSQAVSWAITHGFAPPAAIPPESGASVTTRLVTDGASTEQSG